MKMMKTLSAIGTVGDAASSKIPMLTTGDLSLYFHLPFCRRKCPYCHFFVIPHDEKSQQVLMKSLFQEWEMHRHRCDHRRIVSVYFGGGTPFLMGPSNLRHILSWINPPPGSEVTLEANPEDVTLEAMQQFRDAGINRVSLGVQSLDNTLLKTLGRHHTAEEAISAIHATYKAGITNISIDLMYDIPSQTLTSWKETLSSLSSLPLTHLSLYNLTIEPHTVFYKKRSLLTPLLPSSDDSLEMLQTAVHQLEALGLNRYEISAFARPGFKAVHNTGYWTGRPFLGFGPSAFSYWEQERYRNVCDLKKYATALETGLSPVDFKERLSPEASLHERLAVQLRLVEGVDMREFIVGPAVYTNLVDKGWLEVDGTRARLTSQGLLFYDSVAEEIVL
jgi:oxygen-independent coproporphyrinogen III oxidase